MNPHALALSRRHFLQLSAAASAAVALPQPLRADPTDEVFDDGSAEIPGGIVGDPERVIVVGAGFAGLAAANALANAGVEVVVLEGRDRIGGRAQTVDIGGIPVDVGCSWIHNLIRNPMAQWAEQLGVSTTLADFTRDIGTFTAFDDATGLLSLNETLATFFQTLFFENQTGQLLAALGNRATVEDAIQLYLHTSGLAGDIRRRAEFAIRLVQETGYAAAANDISLDSTWNFPEGDSYEGTDYFPSGGYRALIDPLGAGLEIRLRHRVMRVEHGPDGVVVHTRVKRGRRNRIRRFRGSHVIVTLPLGVLKAGRVKFAPLLPIPKARSIQRLGVGYLEKVIMAFETPFWQEGGKTHLAYASSTPGEFPFFLDLQHLSGGPVIQTFVGGDFGRRMSRMSRRKIRERVLEMLRDVYPSVPRPQETRITRWFGDPYTGGSYSSVPVGATYEDMDQLAAPVGGRLLFAGEATYALRSATADGAFTSGVREAKRLLGQPTVRLRPLAGALDSTPPSWLLRRWLRRRAA